MLLESVRTEAEWREQMLGKQMQVLQGKLDEETLERLKAEKALKVWLMQCNAPLSNENALPWSTRVLIMTNLDKHIEAEPFSYSFCNDPISLFFGLKAHADSV